MSHVFLKEIIAIYVGLLFKNFRYSSFIRVNFSKRKHSVKQLCFHPGVADFTDHHNDLFISELDECVTSSI